ncbi:MAG TPA: TetR/AcrR family transcriptional regulator [Burkholderiaceae bacterium]|nr:TetR/AcrR family transcriptional regulator [Burkholderiaceae bacterium]
MASTKSSQPRTRKKPPASYHHGDLRRALLETTEELLERSGLEAFTLREVARRAGVSHGAPAHHFGDAQGLLTAFTADSFALLADSMAARRRDAPPSPFEQLVATGIGYVEFALAHRARFQLMFRSDRLDVTDEALQQSGSRAYRELVDCIEALVAASRAPRGTVQPKIALAWSIVHGFATLMIDNADFAGGVGRDRAAAIGMLRTMLALARPAVERSRP